MRHPFEWISSETDQKRAFWALFALTLVVMVGLQITGGPLTTDAAPAGIISFEFAGDLATAQEMVQSWGEEGRVYAGLNLGLDYLYLFAYASALSLGCVLVANGLYKRWARWAAVGSMLSWLAWLAALLDAVENFGLIQVLLGTEQSAWPAVARWCAGPKFLLVTLALLYIVLGLIAVLVQQSWKRS